MALIEWCVCIDRNQHKYRKQLHPMNEIQLMKALLYEITHWMRIFNVELNRYQNIQYLPICSSIKSLLSHKRVNWMKEKKREKDDSQRFGWISTFIGDPKQDNPRSSSKIQYKVVRMNRIMLEVNATRILRHADWVHNYGRNEGTVRMRNANTISLGTSKESVVLFAGEKNGWKAFPRELQV